MDVLKHILGVYLDTAITRLYWRNTLFSSDEFTKILEHLKTKNKDDTVQDLKQNLFRVIMRNMLYMSKHGHGGDFTIPNIVEIYMLYGLYSNDPLCCLQLTDVLLNNQYQQLSFINNVVCTNNFPSKYDSYTHLHDFVVECEHISHFVKEKNATCDKNECVHDNIDKILETISDVLGTEPATEDAH